tara:strand:- start:89 stop:649 length:561 start_codon:yes stop_codon:yes gene_type:complete
MSIYKEIHDNLVNSHKHLKEEWKPGSGLERHHIVPRHVGGLDEEDNYTYLTLREHYIVHFLLWKINGRIIDKRVAYMRKDYMWSFEGCQHSLEARGKMRKQRIGKKLSNDTKRKISEGNKGRVYKGKYSHEHISRMRKKYAFLDPHGKIVHIENLLKFCRENNLLQSHMHSVYTGARPQHKGWKSV